jgi:NTE family protein
MNAVALAQGLVEGGRHGARERLAQFWRGVSIAARRSPLQRTLFDMLFTNWSLDHNPALVFYDLMTRVVSPYQFNPLNINPLKAVVEREIDFDKVRSSTGLRLFVSATNVHTGRVKVFTGEEITADVVMASACLPIVFQAVEIDGVPYWDGGYMGNPVLFPFMEVCRSQDIMLVQVHPLHREATPKTAREVLDRVNEISFNASLIKELRLVDFVNRCLKRGELSGLGYREIFVHRIGGGLVLERLSASSKLNAEWAFLSYLRDIGRQAAQEWLTVNFDRIGREGTLDLAPFRDEDIGGGPRPYRLQSSSDGPYADTPALSAE